MTFVLPAGSTGFFTGPPFPSTDYRALLGVVHEVARRAGREVSTTGLDGSHSYRAWRLAHDYRAWRLADDHEAPLWVLAHRHVPLAALVDTDPAAPGASGDGFVDWPPLEPVAIEAVGWRLLRRREATAPPTADALSLLAACEVEEIAYWAPETIGAVVFNWWD